MVLFDEDILVILFLVPNKDVLFLMLVMVAPLFLFNTQTHIILILFILNLSIGNSLLSMRELNSNGRIFILILILPDKFGRIMTSSSLGKQILNFRQMRIYIFVYIYHLFLIIKYYFSYNNINQSV